MRHKILVVDLNNFARFPTLAIGYLTAALRGAGHDVRLFSPLAHGEPGITREKQERRLDHLKRVLYLAPPPGLSRLQEHMYAAHAGWRNRIGRQHAALLKAAVTDGWADVILLSAYLQHRGLVELVGQVAQARGIPVLLGGPVFNAPGVADDWQHIPGISAVFAGEAEEAVAGLVEGLLAGRPLRQEQGIFIHRASRESATPGTAAQPLSNLARLPFPDFSDFPWERYPHRIIPLMASRGCGWGRCLFCSDVTTASGRGFRSRPAAHVLDEMAYQAGRHDSRDFLFLDLKLNSDLALWRGLIHGIPQRLPGARWIGTVHVDAKGDHGLDRTTLLDARAAGLTRVSFGLESGSQRMLQRMAKGCSVERNEQFIRDASAVGLSVRSTMMVGFPGERAEDVDLTTAFLERNHEHLERINLARFKPIPGTRFERIYGRHGTRFPDVPRIEWDLPQARGRYRTTQLEDRHYRASLRRMLAVVHDINKRPLRAEAVQFDGLM